MPTELDPERNPHMTHPGRRFRRQALIASAVALGLTLTACGSSGGDTDGPAAGKDAKPAAELATEAKAKVAEYSAQAPDEAFAMPTEPVTPGSKKIAYLSCGEQGRECHNVGTYVEEAATAAGWTMTPVLDGKFTPSVQASMLQKAVQQKVDAIVIGFVDLNSIKSAVDEALAAKIPITCVLCSLGAYEGKIPNGYSDLTEMGRRVAWSLIARATGPVKVIAFNDKAFPQVSDKIKGMKEVLSTNCSDCTFKEVAIATSDLAKPGPPTFTSTVSANPVGTLTDVIAPYDTFGAPMAKTLLQLNRKDVTISGYEVNEETARGLETGSLPYGASTGSPYEFWSWSAVDNAIRLSQDLPTVDVSDTPEILVTKDNAAGLDSTYYAPAFDYKTKFLSVWGTN